MWIVADTNTVLSGLLWQDLPRRLLDMARQRTVTLSAAELVQDYERLAEVVEPQPLPAPTSRDSDDDHLLACALAAQPDLIVSGDHDLLTLREYQGIPILSTAAALARLTERGG